MFFIPESGEEGRGLLALVIPVPRVSRETTSSFGISPNALIAMESLTVLLWVKFSPSCLRESKGEELGMRAAGREYSIVYLDRPAHS